MNTGIRERAEAIFLLVAETPRDRWEEELAIRCAGDKELDFEVRSLLDCHKVADGFLNEAELGHARPAGPPVWDDVDLPPGTRIGEYVLQSLLGRGGMGHVYVAEQDKPRRTVALKIIRRGFGTAGLLRRFEHEAEVQGRLHHPGIAQIYEAGAANIGSVNGSLQPYIAMELVHGSPLNVHADDKQLSAKERMELAARVCDAVHHAHQHGVIHRDLKPANILVDEHGQPKILDFGVARAADADLRVTTFQTSVGQLIGTLPYMSPEQVLGDPSEVDTRSDVYALGVVLYQLLTGRLPLDVSSRSLVEAARVIREESPTRLGQVSRVFRGDAETIVSKAMEKDKARRYQSAAELADDLRRAVAGEPVHARNDSALYVLRKQLNRHKRPVAAAIVLMAGLLVFALYASNQAGKYASLAVAEKRAKGRADDVASELRLELSASNIERGRLLGLSGNLAAAEDLLWPEHLRNLESRQTFFALWELYARRRCEATLVANRPRALAMRISPDGRLLAACGTDPPVLVWDTNTLETVAAFGAPGVAHTALAFSPAGLLATGDAKGRIAVWDPTTREEKIVLRPSGPSVIDLAFDRTGSVLAATLIGAGVIALGARSEGGHERTIATRPDLPARSLSFSPTADELAIGCADARIRVVTVPNLEAIREIPNPDDVQPRVAYSPDGTLIAAGGAARLARVWNAATGDLKATLSAPNGAVMGVAFTPDSKRLLVIGWWHLHVWDIAAQRIIESFSGYRASGLDLAVSPDGSRAWSNLTHTIRAWDLDLEAGRTRIEAPSTRTLAVFSPTGDLIVGEADGTVSLVTDPKGELIRTLGKSPRRIRAITLSPVAPIAASASVDGTLSLWDLDARRAIAQWPGFRMATNDGMRFDSTGSRLVISAGDSTFKVVEVPSGNTLVTIPADGFEALGAAFSPDDRLVATATRRGFVCLYDAVSGERLRECESPSGMPWTVVFSPDGSKVLSGTWSRTIDVWDVASGKLERTLSGHRGLVTDIAFRPKEPHILASSGADGHIMLWDLSGPRDTPALTLDGFDGWEVWALDFDRNGRRLLGTNSNGLTVIWDLRHFNRHIGGNMHAWIEQHRATLDGTFDERAAAEQRRLLLSRGRASRDAGVTPPPPNVEPAR